MSAEAELQNRWRVVLSPERARALGADVPEGAPPVVLTVELDEQELAALYRKALANKGGRAKDGAVIVRRGRA